MTACPFLPCLITSSMNIRRSSEHRPARASSFDEEEVAMNRTAGLILSGLLAIGVVYANGAAGEEKHDPAALARAMPRATTTLETGLKASEREGKPISAKFEIEDNDLQLSVYTLKGNDAMEVVEDPQTGAIVKSEKITELDFGHFRTADRLGV